MSGIYIPNAPSTSLQIAAPMINLARLIGNFGNTQQSAELTPTNYIRSTVSAPNSVSTVITSILKTMNGSLIPKPLSAPELLRWQDMADEEVQKSNSSIKSPIFFRYDNDLNENSFNSFKQNSDKRTASDHFKILLKHVSSFLRFFLERIRDEMLSLVIFGPIATALLFKLTPLIYWLSKLFN